MAFGNNNDHKQANKPADNNIFAGTNLRWYQRIDWEKLMYASWAVMVLALLGLGFQHVHEKQQLLTVNAEQQEWAKRSDRVQNQINQGILVPSKQAGNLTTQEGKTISFISDLFMDVMTYDSQATYNAARQRAKKYISDPTFFKVFLSGGADNDGNSLIDNSGMKGQGNSVSVFPLGGTHYLVVAAYTPYNNRSDLYQKSSLESMNYVFDVNATEHNISQCHFLNDFTNNYSNQIG